jgi:hypothetical protein
MHKAPLLICLLLLIALNVISVLIAITNKQCFSLLHPLVWSTCILCGLIRSCHFVQFIRKCDNAEECSVHYFDVAYVCMSFSWVTFFLCLVFLLAIAAALKYTTNPVCLADTKLFLITVWANWAVSFFELLSLLMLLMKLHWHRHEEKEQEAKEPILCSICLEETSSFVTFPCGAGTHKFHRPCIQEWLRYGRTCPMCRQEALPSP